MNKNFVVRRTMVIDGTIRVVEYAETPSGTLLEKAEECLAEEANNCTDSGKDVCKAFGPVGKVRLQLLQLSLKFFDAVFKVLLPGCKASSERHLVCLSCDYDADVPADEKCCLAKL